MEINIPLPCPADLSKMNQLPFGKFCDLCQKPVLDLTNLNDEELVEINHSLKGNFCGIFNKNQLNKELIQPKKFSKSKQVAAILSGVMLFHSGNKILAQETKNQPLEPKKTDYSTSDEIFKIEGKLLGENDLPIANTKINFNNKKEIQSDGNGNFTFEIQRKELQTVNYFFIFEKQVPYFSNDLLNPIEIKLFKMDTSYAHKNKDNSSQHSTNVTMVGGIGNHLLFNKNEFHLAEANKPFLDNTSKTINEYFNIEKKIIEGHTNKTEKKELGYKRAKTVYDYLKKNGVDVSKFKIVNKGSSEPKFPESTASETELHKNRRVILKFE